MKTVFQSLGLLSAISLPCVLAACATTGGIEPEQCASVDWQGVGYQDGLLGRDANYVQKHGERCGKAGVTPSQSNWQSLWEQGRQNGLKRYCTPLRAYQLGREGINFNNVCPPEQMLDLIKAHDEGYLNFQREQSLNQWWYNDDPFFGGWRSPFYGRYGRHGYGHVGGMIRVPTPRTLPHYIDKQY